MHTFFTRRLLKVKRRKLIKFNVERLPADDWIFTLLVYGIINVITVIDIVISIIMR